MIREIKVRCAACGHLTRIPTVTNADKIRAMTDEELAEFMSNKVDCQYCDVKTEWCSESEMACRRGWLDWLKQEVSDETA